MALTNTQYESIIREYEKKQTNTRHLLNERQAFVYKNVAGYKALDDATAALSGSFTRRFLDGDPNAKSDLNQALKDLASQKEKLLIQANLPGDYLMPVYECPDCKDSGYIGTAKCHCFQQKIINLLYSQSNITDILLKENFNTLSYTIVPAENLADYRKTVDVCKSFVDTFDTAHRNLLFTGTVGTGKSFLSNCIAKALIDSCHSVIYFSSIDLFDTLSKNVFDKNKQNLYSLYDDLYNCDLVIVDDLGTELTNAFVSSYFFSFLNERQIRQKSTLISTNLNLQQIEDRYSDRSFSRIISNYDICVLNGPDIRVIKKHLSR